MTDQRAAALRAAIEFLSLESPEPELRLLHRYADSWRGIGHVVAGMARQGYDLELRRYNGQGWRAIFFQSGFEHSLTSHSGGAWARSPWEAVQRAANDALYKLRVVRQVSAGLDNYERRARLLHSRVAQGRFR